MDYKKKYKYDIEALPINWYYYSERLYDAAEIIISNSDYEINRYPYMTNGKALTEVFFLNCGLAIENAIKGYLISEDKTLTAEYQIDRKLTANHDLVNLSKYITKIKFSKEEKKLLKILSDCITFWGRYPISKSSKREFIRIDYSVEIHKSIKNLWFKIMRNLYNNITDGWENINGLNSGTFLDSRMEDISDISKFDIKPGNIQL